MRKTFGEKIQACRREKGWTVKQFIEKLGKDLSPAYITKIEVHGEIPSPELTCKIAEVFGINLKDFVKAAKEDKRRQFDISLDRRYEQAIGLYKLQKKKKRLV